MKRHLLSLALVVGLLASLVSSFSTEGLADPRKTEVEYATLHDLPLAAVQKMFSGTVAIVCPNGNSSAQFVGSHTVFTTSAHAFRSLIDCHLVNDPLKCSLVVPEKGKSKVKRLIASGYEDCSNLVLPERDWAVLEIDSPMEDVVPYDLPGDDPHRPPEIEPMVVRVALGEANFLGGPRPRWSVYRKSIEDCSIKDRTNYGLWWTDCAVYKGASGGSILQKLGYSKFELLGVITGFEAAQNDRTCFRDGRNCRSAFVVLTGEFFEAVRHAIANSTQPRRSP